MSEGVNVFDEDWDNLVILDACRYSSFRDHADLPGTLEKRMSKGAATMEFITANFKGRKENDTVYVSANQWYPRLRDEIDAEIYKFLATERDAHEGLTTKPETVTEEALNAATEFPNKRLIVHYMQPHTPFLGPTGKKFKRAIGANELVRYNNVSTDDFKKAYHENLNLVLEEVEKILSELCGKTVVTADHGELLGGRQSPIPVRSFGHYQGIYLKELLEVPWHIYQNGERKSIQPGTPQRDDASFDRDELNQHLQALGYRSDRY
ncbi:hypothetical protein [Halomarina pelagica]|uniref:hypothetical protein n=1 Tax=Halomarina pelagica TaxID=2961599 RepID=UPI0020C2E2E5|nr:hypothetical protein [Halomarina sp. BND7]